jgi:hypothetical protein
MVSEPGMKNLLLSQYSSPFLDSSMTSKSVTKISFSDSDKLVGAHNYMVWAFLVEQILYEKGLWYVVQSSAHAVNLVTSTIGYATSTTIGSAPQQQEASTSKNLPKPSTLLDLQRD